MCAFFFKFLNEIKPKTRNVVSHVYSDRDRRSAAVHLLVRLGLLVVLTDLEVPQLVRLLIRRHHPQPITEVVLLQVLLCQILQIPNVEKCGCLVPEHLIM